PKIRQLLKEGRISEAEQLANLSLAGVPESQRHYQPLGDLNLHFGHQNQNVDNYQRSLDLNQSKVDVQYRYQGIDYHREIFVSFPDQVIVIHLTASATKSINLTAWLDRGHTRYLDQLEAREQDGLFLAGATGGNGVHFHGELKVTTDGGTIETIGNRLMIKEANTATLFVAAATSFRYDDPGQQSLNVLNKAIKKSYQQLKQDHLTDYQELYQRMAIRLADSDQADDRP